MLDIIYLLSIYGLAFVIKEVNGPWGVLSWMRNRLMTNKYVGVFFYQLLSCYFCVGFHCGWMICLLRQKAFHWEQLLIWGLAGGIFSLVMDSLMNRMNRE